MFARITEGKALDTSLYSSATTDVFQTIQPFLELSGGLNPFHWGIVFHRIRFASQILGLKVGVWIADLYLYSTQSRFPPGVRLTLLTFARINSPF